MRSSKFTEEWVVMALRRAEAGTPDFPAPVILSTPDENVPFVAGENAPLGRGGSSL